MASARYEEKPERGDLIEIFRGIYEHWAIYVGHGFVVHLAPPSEVAGAGSSSMMSVLANKAIVKKEKLWDVVGRDKWRINNSLNKKYTPRDIRAIVREANALVGTEQSYSLGKKNCEHFVKKLRYGKAESQQVRKAGEVAVGVAMGLGALALVGTLFEGSKKENKSTQ